MLPAMLCTAILLTLIGPVQAISPGISRISAQDKSLVVTVKAPPAGSLRLVELRPCQTYAPGADLPTVWEGSGREEKGRERERKEVAFEIPRFDGRRDRLYSKFQLVKARNRQPVGPAHYVDDLSALPARDFDFPWPASIKGLQVQDVADAIALGVKYAGINVMIPSVIDWSDTSDERWEVDGEKIPINTAYIGQLDAQFQPLTEAGINVTAILLNGVPSQPDPSNPLIHPNTDLAHAPFHLGAFNTTDERGLRYYRAAVEYLANRYSDPEAKHGWVSGYIIGNEVQAHWEWYNIGRMPLAEFVEHYGIALRVADLAARRFHSKLRIYVSLEHHWNATHRPDPLMAFRGKEFLERLNAWAKAEGDFPWHVAFHPYPENLFEPRFWNDRQAVLSFDSPKITFKNVEVLPAFLRQQHLRYQGQPRRIILSEQGFHTPDGPDGETIQAAAYAGAYYKLSHTPGIDAFILHRHVDHQQEGGLRLGLWTWKEDDPGPCTPDRKKRSYEVFRLADTDQWETAFEFAKPILGIESWDEVLPSRNVEATPDLTPALTLIADGKSDYRIVIPEKADVVVRFAAQELQHFLAEMSGVTLPILTAPEAKPGPAVLLGQTGGNRRLKEDGVFIKTVGGDVILGGPNARGQLYSVYVLLERYLGVRFLARDCTVVPKRDVVTLPQINYTHAPPFMYRETLYFDSFPKEIAARQRLNGPATQCDETVGGKIAFQPYVHSFCQLVPPDVYFAEHPEYFSLVGGQRTSATIHGQLCLTHPDVLKVATEQVLRWLEEYPDVPIFDVSQNDGNGPCECEKCLAVVQEEGSQHGPILRFVNAIADAVAEKDPSRWVETLAYAYSTKPPALTKPRDNVIIRLCHAGCYFHGFERCGLGANLTAYLEGWSQLTKRIFVWHYATNFAHYLAPNPNLDGLARDIQYYAAHGVNGLMVQGDYQSPGGELAELRQYLAAQLMWDPNRDPGTIRLEFCNGYYGPAANDVLDYLALLDRTAKDPNRHAFGAWDPKETVTPGLVAEGLEILTRARGLNSGEFSYTPEVANRVGKLLLPLWYMQLADPERYGLDSADARQVLLEFKSVVEANRITHVCEGGENMAGWLAEMEARYGAVPESLVYDLYLQMGQARRENCLDY